MGNSGFSKVTSVGVKGMSSPKVKSVSIIDDYTLLVEFENNRKRQYDVSPLLENPMFLPLKNSGLFKLAKVEAGGYAVSWGSDIDISEHELWTHGFEV